MSRSSRLHTLWIHGEVRRSRGRCDPGEKGRRMNGHILIAGEDPQHAKLLAFLLADAGHRSATLADPREVGPFLRDHAVDLVLLGAAPTADPGFEVCARLRRDHPDTPVI